MHGSIAQTLVGYNIWIFRQMLEQMGVKTAARRAGRAQSRCVWIEQDAWAFLLSILERRQAKRSALAVAATPVALTDSLDVVTPPI